MGTVAVAALCRELTADRRTDGELLAAFTSGDSEAAFSELIRRHGPLVWGACRRLLPNPDDAEDAFQAAFLVLVRRAHRLTRSPALGPWLHRVAVWTARNVRRKNARRFARHEPLPDHLNDPAAPPDPDLKADLDAALLALPSRYRQSIILCHLQGFTRREAAERLGCAEGTLSAWLHRGLAKLRTALRDFEPLKLPALALAVPPTLAASTAHAAVATAVAGAALPPAVHSLVEGVLHMFWVKKATAATVALFATFALGVGMGVSSRGDHSAATAGDGPALGKPELTQPKPPGGQVPRVEVLEKAIRTKESALRVLEQECQVIQQRVDARRASKVAPERLEADIEALERVKEVCGALSAQIEGLRAKLEVAKAQPPAAPAARALAKEIAELEARLAIATERYENALRSANTAAATTLPEAAARSREDADYAAAEMKLLKDKLNSLKAASAEEKLAKPKPAPADPFAKPPATEIDEKLRELRKQLDQLQDERQKLDSLKKQTDEQAAKLDKQVHDILEAAKMLQAKRAELDRKVEAAKPGAYLELKVSGNRVADTPQGSLALTETDASGKPIGTAVLREQAMLQKFLARAKADPTAPKELRVTIDPDATLTGWPVAALKACEAAGYTSVKFTGYVFGGGFPMPLKPDQKGEVGGYKHHQGAEKKPSELIKEIEEGMRRF
jgi:RNA polymerase sigma factor (sigma-70 family)